MYYLLKLLTLDVINCTTIGKWIREWDQGKGGCDRAVERPDLSDQVKNQVEMYPPHTVGGRHHRQLAPLPIQLQNSIFQDTRKEFVSGRGRARSQVKLTDTNCASALTGKEEIVSGRGRGRGSVAMSPLSIPPLVSPGVARSPSYVPPLVSPGLPKSPSIPPLVSPGVPKLPVGGTFAFEGQNNDVDLNWADSLARLDSLSDEFSYGSSWADLPTPTLLRREPPTF